MITFITSVDMLPVCVCGDDVKGSPQLNDKST